MPRDIVIVGHPGVLGMELTGAHDVFEMANHCLIEAGRPPEYRIHVVSADGAPLTLWGGLQLAVTESLAGWRRPIDTLVVVGGHHAHEAALDPDLVGAVRRAAGRSRRVAGLCTAAFILGAAGLLDGKRATTHWMFGELLAERCPAASVDTDSIFIGDDGTWTSAGITAATDLLLALVEADLGPDVARSVARILVVFLRRTGNQAQFSAQLAAQASDRQPVRELQQYIADHPEADLSLAALAAQVHMSPRHFARVFCAEVGMTPGRYVERARLETARRRLEETELPVETVAVAAGFGSAETMRRIFVQTLGVSPAEYRRRFGTTSGDNVKEINHADRRSGTRRHPGEQQDLRRAVRGR